MFDIKNQDTFLGGQNVHNLLILGMLGFLLSTFCNLGNFNPTCDGNLPVYLSTISFKSSVIFL